MEKGAIIYLNGVTSTGKTSIAQAIQQRSERFFYAMSNDLFMEMVGDKYLEADFWLHLGNAIFMMYRTARLYSDMGHNVIIDGMVLERYGQENHYKKLLEIMSDSPMYMVDVHCPLEICRQRNIARGDRGEYQSQGQYDTMEKNLSFFCRVETDKMTSDECADAILREVFGD